jgi:hypothetical protein
MSPMNIGEATAKQLYDALKSVEWRGAPRASNAGNPACPSCDAVRFAADTPHHVTCKLDAALKAAESGK